MATFKDNITQPWAIRRIFYGLLALIGAGLLGFGIADAAQIDQWTESLDRILTPLLLVLGGGVAGVKANPGSDMKRPVEAEQVAPVQAETTPAPARTTPTLEQLRDTVASTRAKDSEGASLAAPERPRT